MTVGKHFILLKILYHSKNVSFTFSFSVKSYKKLCDFFWNFNIFLHSVFLFKFVKLVGCQSSTGGHSPIWLHVLESSRNLVFRIAQLQIFSPHKMMTWGKLFERSLNCERYSCGHSFNVKFNILINLSNMKGTMVLQI
jgi:hypothetical protein